MAIGHFCRILAEFSLEYRTTRERILEQNAKKANDQERKQTRGKLIDDVSRSTMMLLLLAFFVLCASPVNNTMRIYVRKPPLGPHHGRWLCPCRA